jgi:hypothetical protein
MPDSEQPDGSLAEPQGYKARALPNWRWVVKETKPRAIGARSAVLSPTSPTFRHRWNTADLNRTNLAPAGPVGRAPTRGDRRLVLVAQAGERADNWAVWGCVL